MKKQVGEEVIIRKDLIENEKYGTDVVVDCMLEFKDKKAKIVDIIAVDCDGTLEYVLDIDDGEWTWTDEMFE